MDFDVAGARKAGYSEGEIAAYLADRHGFDLEGAKSHGYSDGDVVNYLTSTPKATDYLKSAASGALSGAGMIAQGGGELVARGVNAVAGTELRAINPLQGAIDWIEQSKSPGAKRAEAGTQITGSLFEPSTWSAGTDPSLSGLALQGLNAIGQFAPNLAIAIGTAGASVPAQLAIGATVGGLQALGGGAEEERNKFMAMSPEELKASSKLYNDLIARNVDPQTAKSAVAEAAALGGGIGNAIPSAAEGAFENFLIGALTRGRLHIPGKGVLGKTVVGATGGAAVGGTEEALEQVGQNIGSNLAIGGNRPITADTLQQFVMGAIAEGAAGGGGGAAAGLLHSKPTEQPLEQPAVEQQGPTLALPAPVLTGTGVSVETQQAQQSAIDQADANAAGLEQARQVEEARAQQAFRELGMARTVDEAVELAMRASDPAHLSDVAHSIVLNQGLLNSVELATPREGDFALANGEVTKKKEQELGQIVEAKRDQDVQQAIEESTRREEGGQPQTAMQSAFGKLILRRMEAMEKAREPADVRVFGKPVEQLNDEELAHAAENHRMSGFREAARAEIARRRAPVTTQGETNAVQVEGADAGSVQRSAGPGNEGQGEAVRGGNTEPQQVAAAGAQAQAGTPQQQVAVAQPPAIAQQLYVERGGRRFPVATLKEASDKWEEFRSEAVRQGGSASDVGNGRVVDQNGAEVARISYNGKVWPPGPWKPGAKPLVGKTFAEEQAARVESEARAAAQAPAPVTVGGRLEQPEPASGQSISTPAAAATPKPITFMGKPLGELNARALQTASKNARSKAVREAAAAELERRHGETHLEVPADMHDSLRKMAESAVWFEEGGKAMGGNEPTARFVGGKTIMSPGRSQTEMNEAGEGRTHWVGMPDWARGLGMNKADFQASLEKAIAGKPLGAKQKQAVQAMMEEVKSYRELKAELAAEGVSAQEQAVAQQVLEGSDAPGEWNKMSHDDQEAYLDSLFGPSTAAVGRDQARAQETPPEEVRPAERQPGEDDDLAAPAATAATDTTRTQTSTGMGPEQAPSFRTVVQPSVEDGEFEWTLESWHRIPPGTREYDRAGNPVKSRMVRALIQRFGGDVNVSERGNANGQFFVVKHAGGLARTKEEAERAGDERRRVIEAIGSPKQVDRPALELSAPTEQDLKAKEQQAATGNVEERHGAVRDRNEAILTAPEGTAPPRSAAEQKVPTAQESLFSTAASALREAADKIEKAAQPPKPSEENGEKGKLTDVGENLWYNRRNFTGKATTWDDVKGLNDALKVKEVVKQKVWPKPDYAQLVEDGLQPIFARFIKQVYDGISTAPAGKSDADLERYISAVGKVRDAAFEWAKDGNANQAFLEEIARQAKLRMERRFSISSLSDKVDITNVIIDRVWPESKGDRYRFRNNAEVTADARALGGNRALKAMQFTIDDAVAAMKDLEHGWPTPQESWQRQGYKVAPSSQATVTEGGSYEGDKRIPKWFVATSSGWSGQTISGHPTKEAADEALKNLKPFMLLNKRGRLMSQHDTEEQAKEAARELVKREVKGGDIRGMNISAAERTGPARRKEGENATPQRLMDEFGFRGVNFGREGWINQSERQAYLNHAYDGLLDLAEILGVPQKALSLNGMLGIAFGAQGRGGTAAAHFVPGHNEINLTKTMGAGTLAHEWGHALDHYFATQAGLSKSDEPWMSSHATLGATMTAKSGAYGSFEQRKRFGEEIRPEIAQAFREVVETMEKRPMTEEEFKAQEEGSKARALKGLESWLQHLRKDVERVAPEKVAEFDAIAERMRKGERGNGMTKAGGQVLSEPVARMKLLVKGLKGTSTNIASNWNSLESNASHVAYVLAEKQATKQHIPQTTNTTYAGESSRKDQEKKGKAYWRTRWEMFARAFETWVAGQLEEQTRTNTFLSAALQRAEDKTPEGAYYQPYPRGDDRARINTAIGKLVDAIETKETDKGTAMFSRQGSRWYSALERGVEALKQGSASAAQWKATLKGMKGISPEELEWSGVNDWLEMQPGKVTKEQLLDYLRDNGVQVEETLLSQDENSRTSELDRLKVELDALGYSVLGDHESDGAFGVVQRSTNTLFSDTEGAADIHEENAPVKTRDELPQNVREKVDRLGFLLELREDSYADLGGDSTRYDQYTLPGGQNYRELLLTLPMRLERAKVVESGGYWYIEHPGGSRSHAFTTKDAAEKEQARVIARRKSGEPSHSEDVFKSVHFSQPNVLAHVRFNERTDADGKRVLFIEEIQSDWAQKGRREGFKLDEFPSELPPKHEVREFTNTTGHYYQVVRRLEDGRTGGAGGQSAHTREEAIRNYWEDQNFDKPPRAPFVGKTDAWASLALKRMVGWAAENGFDRVAWTTGEQQVDRYDLSKRVDAVEVAWVRVPIDRGNGHITDEGPEGKYVVNAYRGDNRVIEEQADNENEIADIIGKDLARKAVERIDKNEPERTKRAVLFQGLDLKLGGEGMRSFYDEILPKVANRLLGKLGGGRVGEFYLGRDESNKLLANDSAEHAAAIGAAPVPGFDITPSMKEAVSNGLPLFARGEGAAAGLTRSALREEVAKAFGNKAAERLLERVVSPVQKQSELPKNVTVLMRNGDRVFAVYDPKTDKVHTVLENLSAADVRGLVLHEVGVHYGFERMLGKEKYDQVLRRMEALRKAGNKDVQEAYAQARKEASRASHVPEETLAYLVQNKPKMNLVQEIIAAIKAFLYRELGIGADKLTTDDMAALARAAVLRAGGPEKITEAAPAFHRAFHGSPHDFDRFSLHKIGSGEGAQSFGWGLYFAGKKDVAEYYRKTLAGPDDYREVLVNGSPESSIYNGAYPLRGEMTQDEMRNALTHVVYYVRLYKDAQKGLAEAKAVAKRGDLYPQGSEVRDAQRLFEVANVTVKDDVRRGKLYEVELAPKENEYLDWDKPVSKQSVQVRDAIARIAVEQDLELDREKPASVFYDDLARKFGGPKEGYPSGVTGSDPEAASKRLLEAGVPGIKYLDQFSRGNRPAYTGDTAYIKAAESFRADGKSADQAMEGLLDAYKDASSRELRAAVDEIYDIAPNQTSNYVIFDDKHVNIEAKFSRAGWIDQQPAATQEALRKAGVWHVPPTIKDRIAAWKKDWAKRMRQGLVDQFDPIKDYDYKAYVLARMTKGADAALDGILHYGTVYLDKDGAVDVNFEKGGFIGLMSELKGEHDRFLAWVIGNRAERLTAEGRENNFTPADIAKLKALNQGQMPDGSSRANAYAKARIALDRYNKSVLDIAEKSGLIDGGARAAWEKEFYVPFYRLADENDGVLPQMSRGLVNQYAFKVLKGGERELGDPLENVMRNWSHLLDASLKNQAAREALLAAEKVGAATEADEATARSMAKSIGKKDGALSFVDQGKTRWFVVDDPFLLDALRSIGYQGFSGPGMKVMGKFKRWLTAGVTISPTFRIRNVIRDSLQMIGTNPASYNVLDNILTGWKATKEGSPEFASILAGGGVMRFGSLLEGDRAEHVKRLIEAGIDDKTVLDTPEKVKAMLREAWDWWQHTGDRAENINRAALYKKLRADGKTHLEASFAARDTMDFSMQGTFAAVRILAQTVPFMNARLQGLYKIGRGAVEDPRRFGIVVGGAALASMALLLAYKDDDDWKQREDWDRETYWWFKVGDKAFRIPKPFEIGAIATLAERGLELMATDQLTGKQFASRVYNIVSQQLSMNPVPQMFMPLIEVYANYDSFTNRPIETMGMERLSKSQRTGPGTSATAQLLGANGFVSPVEIDHLVQGYFGWLGSHIVSTSDLALRPAMGLPPKPAYKIDDVLVAGDFVRDLPQYQSRYVTNMYDQMKDVQEAMADLKHLQQIGATEDAQKLLESKRDKIALYHLYTHAQQQMNAVNKRISMVQARASDPELEREQLDALYGIRNRIARVTEEAARARQAQ